VRILFIGDVVGRTGRDVVAALVPDMVRERGIDLVVANGENAAGGIGITSRTADELFHAGVDVLTSGNHVWHKRESYDLLDESERIVRPANYPPGAPGTGSTVVGTTCGVPVGIVNLQGRVFMQEIDCPFRTGSEILRSLRQETPVIIVDIHAEATSEKLALGRYLAGQATAVLGTHTHVQTADERIIGGHTAYVTDVGMTGPSDSVIGIRTDLSIARFVTQLPQRFEAAKGPGMLNAVVIDADETTGAARGIERVAAAVEF
jgi:metallophosphoesterase (TIGR00282 family)